MNAYMYPRNELIDFITCQPNSGYFMLRGYGIAFIFTFLYRSF